MKAAELSKTPLTMAFRPAPDGRKPLADRPNGPAAQFDFGLDRKRDAPPSMPSFPPCLIPAVDGIFRPGGGRPGIVSKNIQESLPTGKKLATREGTSRLG
jgi:hypothetical protein